MKKTIFFIALSVSFIQVMSQARSLVNFNKGWRFFLGDDSLANQVPFDDSKWESLDLPHDWSIEGNFSDKYPTGYNEAALPAGIGWYRKAFFIPRTAKNKKVYICFDGVYKNSEVWINGHYLGRRPNGYISFRYDMTPYLNIGGAKNIIAVKVDNSRQPDSRWYTGSGIYRNVWLLTTNKIAVDQWGVFASTPESGESSAKVEIKTTLLHSEEKPETVNVQNIIYDARGKIVAEKYASNILLKDSLTFVSDIIEIKSPVLWSVENPALYRLQTKVYADGILLDDYNTNFGIRNFYFDAGRGFFLNGKHLKILGVCNHHDLGALGAAVNKRAIERQLQILKAMGCNGIRTAHNPPAPELLELCDKMGFIVMDEAFDMWMKRKNKKDYHLDFADWHKADLEAQVKRDRNHPSVFIWSIGNEIREQFDSSGIPIARELVDIIKAVDTTRPITSALTENNPEKNFIYQSGALDLLGFNYKLQDYPSLPLRFPGQKFIAAETMSALATRGHYDMPSDSVRHWPPGAKNSFVGNADLTVSAYDNVCAYWGSTHEQGWNAVKKYPFLAGLYVWSGFDFLGEPVPYKWPARSSYYGIIDLAGFPKDVYYMYQSEWTDKPVLHIFPHWNWKKGQTVDVWAYYNNADEVELFLNEKSLGIKRKMGDDLHVMWRVNFEPGVLRAVSRRDGKTVLTKEIRTAGMPAKIQMTADRKVIQADGKDLSFITVQILDKDGNAVPYADNMVQFSVHGKGFIAGVDNGLQTGMEPFKAKQRRAFNGLCLAIIQSNGKRGRITVEAKSEGLDGAVITLRCK